MIKNDSLETKRTSSRCVFISMNLVSPNASTMCVGVLNGDSRMAALTKRHEVALVIRAAVCQRQDVMHFLSGGQSTFTLALLTQRMQ